MKYKFIIAILLLVSTVSFSQSITEVYFPKYIQGVGSFVFADERRVPFVCRLKISGLLTNATYRYYNRFVLDPANTSIGEGNYILVKDTGSFVRVTAASLGTAGRYGEFTTDSTGSFTGWFANDASISTTFTPGNDLYFRLVLNNGAGDIVPTTFLTSPNSVKVINFGTGDSSGTALRATPLNKGVAKQFVLLYDNLLGFGRPVTGTFIESDGTNGNIASGYAPFYADSVNGIDKTFGTIVPNNLSNGILHIAQRSIAGSLKQLYLSFDGRWPSVNSTLIDTKNTSGGLDNVLVINGSRLYLLNFWLSSEAASEDLITLQWSTPAEDDVASFIVEKSTDGATFSEVTTIRKSTNRGLYELQEARTESNSFYRLKMISKAGEKTYSEVLKVNGLIKIGIYPNPVQAQLLVKHPKAETGTTVQVVGADGRQLLNQNVQEGTVQTTVNVKSLVSGNYFLVYRVNGQRQSKLFVKQ